MFRDFPNDFPVAVRRSDVALDGRGVEGPLILHLIERLDAGLRVHFPDLLALFQKDAVHFHLRRDDDGLVLHQPAVADRLLDAVAEHALAKERDGVRGGRGGEADADGVERIERVAPDARLLRRVAAVALGGEDEVEGVNRNFERVRVISPSLSPPDCANDSCAPKQFRAMRCIVET